MQITKETTVAKTEVDDVICNNCGKSCKSSDGSVFSAHAVAFGGFGSRRLADQHLYRFDLCEDCTCAIAKNFKIPPEVRFCGPWDESDEDPEISWEETLAHG